MISKTAMNSINKIVKESGINFIGSLLGNILGYIWLMLMARYISQEDFGSFTLAQSIINISMIFVLLGTHKSLDRYIPIYHAAGEEGKIKHIIWITFQIAIIMSFVVGFSLFAGRNLISNQVFSNPTLSRLLPILILTIPLLALTLIVIFSFGGYKELRYYVYLKQFLEPALKILFMIIVAVLGLGIIQWTWLYLIALLITAVAAGWFLFNGILKPLADVPVSRINFREILSYSWPISISSILILLIGQIDYIILGIYHPAANLSIYRIYIQIVALLKLILGSIARIYKPVISELIPEKKYAEINNTYGRISKWVLALTTLGVLVIILYGNRLTSLFFTGAYSVYPMALIILALGTYLNSAFGPEGMTLEAFGNTKLIMINSLITLAVNIGLGLLLIPEFGLVGAAIASGVTLTLGGLLGFLEINYLYKMQPFSSYTLKFIFIGLLTGGVFAGFDLLLKSNSIFHLFLSIGLLVIFYISGLLITRCLDEVDRNIINQIITRFTPQKTN